LSEPVGANAGGLADAELRRAGDAGLDEPLGAGVPEPPDRNGAFPRLDEDQRARLRMVGDVRKVSRGEVLFKEGDESYDFFLVESGAVTIVQGYGCEDRVIAVHGAHRFLGELSLLTGSTAYLTAVVRDPGEVVHVPLGRLRTFLRQDNELANIILRAFLARREILIEAHAGVKVVGSRFSGDTKRLREFLARNRMPHQWMDVERDRDAEALLCALGVSEEETPVVLGAGHVMRNPSNAEIAAALGLGARGAAPEMCDLVIVGGGPAGLAAAVYGASEGLDTQAIDKFAFGGQAGTSSRIENYLGFPTGVPGFELMASAALQAKKFGARLVVPGQAVRLAREDGHYAIALEDGGTVNGRAIVIATGAKYRKLDLPDLERWEGDGVYYAATTLEAQMCFGDPVLVVGGGNSAGQAAVSLSERASSCKLLIRGGDLGKSMSRYLVNEIERCGRVDVETYGEIVELKGEGELETAVVADPRTGERREIYAKAVFVLIGAEPHTDWLDGQVATDGHGFLLTGREIPPESLDAYAGEQPLFLETSRPGVFAVGDVRSGSVKRCASAVGEGSMAVSLVHRRLSDAVSALAVGRSADAERGLEPGTREQDMRGVDVVGHV
jgi:thioredoxin reductase (NADPH)